MEQLWRVEEVADFLAVEPKTVSIWARTRGLPAIKIGHPVQGKLRFEPQAVRDWVRSFALEPPRGH